MASDRGVGSTPRGAVPSAGRSSRPRSKTSELGAASSVAAVAVVLAVHGCSCGPAPPDGSDGGPLFGGIDASEYEPTDSGPRPPEPCDVPTRRIAFPVGEGSLSRSNGLWVTGSRVWAFLPGDFPSTVPSALRWFDLDAERELEPDVVLGASEDDVVGVFEVPSGYEVVVRAAVPDSFPVIHLDHDGRRTEARFEALSVYPLVRLDDGRYAGVEPFEGSSPVEAALELAAPSGDVQRIELGFVTSRGHVRALHWNGETLLGLGYDDERSRVVRYEVDPVTSSVRLATLLEDVRVGGTNGRGLAIWSDATTATAAVVHHPLDAPLDSEQWVAEVFVWEIGEETMTRHVVRPPSDVGVAIYALGGEMPLQTLVLAHSVGFRVWVTATRIRSSDRIEGGSEPIGVYTQVRDAEAWTPSEGTAALALLTQQELQVLYVCEGAP